MKMIMMMMMKRFNRRNSHGQHGSKRRELAQHAHSRGSHPFTHTLNHINTVTTRLCEAPAQLLFVTACWVFRVSVIHRILTWATGFLTCIRGPSYTCVYTHGGWAHRQRYSATLFTRTNSQIVIVFLTGFEPSSFGS